MLDSPRLLGNPRDGERITDLLVNHATACEAPFATRLNTVPDRIAGLVPAVRLAPAGQRSFRQLLHLGKSAALCLDPADLRATAEVGSALLGQAEGLLGGGASFVLVASSCVKTSPGYGVSPSLDLESQANRLGSFQKAKRLPVVCLPMFTNDEIDQVEFCSRTQRTLE